MCAPLISTFVAYYNSYDMNMRLSRSLFHRAARKHMCTSFRDLSTRSLISACSQACKDFPHRTLNDTQDPSEEACWTFVVRKMWTVYNAKMLLVFSYMFCQTWWNTRTTMVSLRGQVLWHDSTWSWRKALRVGLCHHKSHKSRSHLYLHFYQVAALCWFFACILFLFTFKVRMTPNSLSEK